MGELKVNIHLFILATDSKIWGFHRTFLNGENMTLLLFIQSNTKQVLMRSPR